MTHSWQTSKEPRRHQADPRRAVRPGASVLQDGFRAQGLGFGDLGFKVSGVWEGRWAGLA